MDKTVLKKQLATAIDLYNLYKSADFQNHLVPYLEKLATVPHVNPSHFTKQEEYYHALNTANITAGAYTSLLTFLKHQEGSIKKLRLELDKPTTSYAQ